MFAKKIKKGILKKNTTKVNNIRGFTLLFAVLVSTLVLSVGASVISIALKQLVISGTGRDSQYAFYAANTGIECATYWDLLPGSDFATSSDSGNTLSPLMACADNRDLYNKIYVDKPDFYGQEPGNAESRETFFRLTFEDSEHELPYCVDVTVLKYVEPAKNGQNKRIATKITANGYNTCKTDNPRRIERGLEINY